MGKYKAKLTSYNLLDLKKKEHMERWHSMALSKLPELHIHKLTPVCK
jgi:hypothetical protein